MIIVCIIMMYPIGCFSIDKDIYNIIIVFKFS